MPLVHKESKVLQEFRGTRASLVRKEVLDHRESKGSLGLKEILV